MKSTIPCSLIRITYRESIASLNPLLQLIIKDKMENQTKSNIILNKKKEKEKKKREKQSFPQSNSIYLKKKKNNLLSFIFTFRHIIILKSKLVNRELALGGAEFLLQKHLKIKMLKNISNFFYRNIIWIKCLKQHQLSINLISKI